jgi:fructokinase
LVPLGKAKWWLAGIRAVLIGIDFGGTKIEATALDGNGACLVRLREPTPDSYDGALATVAALVAGVEHETALVDRIGIGAPGSASPSTGLIRNANTLYLNGRRFADDLARVLGKKVRLSNDANCFALSEAVDGAGAGAQIVFAVILGTGCGGGLAIDGHVLDGPNGVAGEWGHVPLPWPAADDLPAPACWCGQLGCLETWISGSGLERDHYVKTGFRRTAQAIIAAARDGESVSVALFDDYLDRLARALAMVVNIIDPDVFVFGGGLSNVPEIYDRLPSLIRRHVFGDEWDTPLRPARWGDSSGVRGAARLWEASDG